MPDSPEPFHLPADRGGWYAVLGDVCRTLVSGAQTGGTHSLVEIRVPPGGGPPMHIHTREDETFHILEGEVEFTVADRRFVAGPGATVFAPRGIPHRFHNAGDRRARFLVLATPGGLERFFAGFSHPLDGPDSVPPGVTPADIERLLAVAPEYGLQILPPPGA